MDNELRERFRRRGARGRIITGLLLLFIGAITLLQKINNPFPQWLFTWPSLVIVMGLFVGIKNKFRGGFWIVMMLLGGFFLLHNINPAWQTERYELPAFLIVLGLSFLFRPKHRSCHRGFGRWEELHRAREAEKKNSFANNLNGRVSSDDVLDIVSVFGGTKKIIDSKDFKGGEVTSFLGGTELNLLQADIRGRVVLDLTQVLGGTKLIVPANWEIQPDLTSVFGGVEDKRNMTMPTDAAKVLVLKGVSVLGGIEIRNY